MADKRLESTFDADVEITDADDAPEPMAPEDLRPLVVFLIPGIRSNRVWAQNFHLTSRSVIGREIFPYVVSGASDLGTLDVIFRRRVARFRAEFLAEIKVALSRHRDADVAFICHSMGSSIMGEIADDVADLIETGTRGHKAHAVIFLASICDRVHATSLGRLGRWSVNDAGLSDIIVVLAGLLNPWRYDPVGRFGMARAPFQDRFFRGYGHTDPVTEAHLSTWVLPIIEDNILRRPEARIEIRGWTTFRYMRRALWWVAVPGLVVWLGWLIIT